MKRKGDPPGRIPLDEAATEAEISAAIEGLSVAEGARLQMYAKKRVRGISPEQLKSRDWHDLLTDSFSKTIDGTRRWRKTVLFVHHMLGVMRSTAGHWAEEAHSDPAMPASQVATVGPDGETDDPLEVGSGAPSQERAIIATEKLDELRRHFAGEDLILLLIDGLGEGYTPSELPGLLEISENECRAALKKLRRRADRLFPNGGAS